MRTPLNAIDGVTGLIKEMTDKNFSEDVVQLFDIIEINSNRIITTMSKIMDIAQRVKEKKGIDCLCFLTGLIVHVKL